MSHRQNPKFQRLFESSRELELSWLDFLEKSVGFTKTKYGGFFFTTLHVLFIHCPGKPPQNRTDLNSRAYRNNGPNRNKSAAIPELLRFWWWPDGIEITAAATALVRSGKVADMLLCSARGSGKSCFKIHKRSMLLICSNKQKKCGVSLLKRRNRAMPLLAGDVF